MVVGVALKLKQYQVTKQMVGIPRMKWVDTLVFARRKLAAYNAVMLDVINAL